MFSTVWHNVPKCMQELSDLQQNFYRKHQCLHVYVFIHYWTRSRTYIWLNCLCNDVSLELEPIPLSLLTEEGVMLTKSEFIHKLEILHPPFHMQMALSSMEIVSCTIPKRRKYIHGYCQSIFQFDICKSETKANLSESRVHIIFDKCDTPSVKPEDIKEEVQEK